MPDRRLTPVGDHPPVWKAIVGVWVVALVLAAGGSAASSAGAGGGVLPTGWTHAEINFSVGGVPHTLLLDRGRVTGFSSSSLTLREQDGSSVDVAFGPATQFVVNGQPGQPSDLRRGALAVTQRIDGGPATRVRLQLFRLRR
jgi:hypothetical protein